MKTPRVLAIVLMVGLLVSCAQERDPLFPAAPSPSPISSDREASDASPAPSFSTPIEYPVGITCEELLTANALYEYNPNVGYDPGYRASDDEKIALASGGIACGWINQTSQEPLSVAVARLDGPGLAARQNGAATADGAVALVGAAGYFRAGTSGGVIDAFIGDYWVMMTSPEFFSEDDGETLLEALQVSLQ